MTVKNDFFSAIGVVALAAFVGVLAWKIIDSATNPVSPPPATLAEIPSSDPAVPPATGEPATQVSHEAEFIPNIQWDKPADSVPTPPESATAPLPPESTANPAANFAPLPATNYPQPYPTVSVPEPPAGAQGSTARRTMSQRTARQSASQQPATRPARRRLEVQIPNGAPQIAQFEGVPIDTRFYPVTNANLPQRLPTPSGVELTSTYDNSIKPDEDLLLEPGQVPVQQPPDALPETTVEQPVVQQPAPVQPNPVVEPPQVQQPATVQQSAQPATQPVVQQTAPVTQPAPTANPAAVSPEEDLLVAPSTQSQPVAPQATVQPTQPQVVQQQPVAPQPTAPPPVRQQPPVQQQPVVQQQPTNTAPQATTTPSAPLSGNWSNTIAPDEDLLTGTGVGPTSQSPATSSAQPVTPPATNSGVAQQPPTPQTPVQPPQPQTVQTQPAPQRQPNSFVRQNTPQPEEDLLGPATQTQPTTPQPKPQTVQTQPKPTQPKPAQPKPAQPKPQQPAQPKQLATQGSNPHSTEVPKRTGLKPGEDPHLAMYQKSPFPSAKECRVCHEKIYEEWASSSHAYASMSSMFHKFEQHVHGLTQGTMSAFCVRCHSPLATTLAYPREESVWDSIPAAREGVTCVVCHRVNEEYGKVDGERRILPGDIHDPVYGSGYGEELEKVLANKQVYKVKERGDKGPGQKIHGKVIHFEQISSSHFCVSCHQVAVKPGIALEVVWAQYRRSPACKAGVSCQDCHMGAEPGVNAGYETAPVAIVNGKEISPNRRHSNHLFYGPGYSIAHPGLFPFHKDGDDWTVQEWMEFDWRAGWGTEAFEDAVDEGKINASFPEAWENADDRADARDVVNDNLEKLEAKRRMRHRLMENGSHLEGPIFAHSPKAGRTLKFHYKVQSLNSGHNIPSGSLGAQPQCWLNVALTGPNGQHLWESGYVDAYGDIADVHSLDVAAGKIKRDVQLFNLQTKFLITGVKGTEREMSLPINIDFDQLPFIRASGFPHNNDISVHDC
ncbi:MAG: multiheme c-type cytochrome, partial [Planctomycetota bacterium]